MSRQILFALMSVASALRSVHESQSTLPRGWSATNGSLTDGNPTFTIALAMRNLASLEPELTAVSDPHSPTYGAFWSEESIETTFWPSDTAVSSVLDWLESHSITEHRVDGLFIDFVCNISTADSLLNASYQYYTNLGVTKLRTASYSIPDDLQQYIALVDPGTYFGSPGPLVPTPVLSRPADWRADRQAASTTNTTIDAACQTSITPSCLKQMYNVAGYEPSPGSRSRIGFASFLNQTAKYSDLAQFEDHFGIPAQNFSVEPFAGAADNQSSSQYTEANLDVQTIVGIAHPLPVVEYMAGGSPPFIPNLDHATYQKNFNEPWVPYYRNLLAKPTRDLPQVISHSYGDLEFSVPYDYATVACNLIGLMGLRGVTIIQASGDSGVGAGCLAPDSDTVTFNAMFPATCPWLTSVGGTVGVSPEQAWAASSGGFSGYFPRPAYQDDAVSAYVRTVRPDTRDYYGRYTNWSGRGFPDVAAHSLAPNFQVVYGGELAASGGTSAAAPVWAAVVGLLDDARLRAGRPVLGWLNPLIYRYGSVVLTDITEGYSVGCDGVNPGSGVAEPAGAGIVPGARWNATVGWDTVTGWGTPDFEKMRDLVLKL